MGFAFNINTAKNNFNEFSLMISDQMDDNELKNLNIGYNAKNNTMFIINNNMNNNINNNNNINILNNKETQNNQNNDNFENLNNQIKNMNLNQENNNNNQNNYRKIDSKYTINKIKKKMNIKTKDVLGRIINYRNEEKANEEEANTTMEFLKKNAPDFLKPKKNINLMQTNDNLMNSNNGNPNNNNNNYNTFNNVNNLKYNNNNISSPYMHKMNYNNTSNINNFNINLNDCPNQDYRNFNTTNMNSNNQNQINNYNNIQNCFNNQNIFQNQINYNLMLDNFPFPRNDLLKSLVRCLSNCQIVFENIINFNEQQFMPIVSSLNYIFQKNDYIYGLSKLKENLNRASKQINDLDEPKNVFSYIIESINNEIGGCNSNQNNSLIQYNNYTNRDSIYNEFLNRIFNPQNNTFISQNFFGIREIISICYNCNNMNYNFEIFKFLEFSVEDINNYLVNKLREYIQKGGYKNKYVNSRFAEINDNNLKNLITLKDCFAYYSKHDYRVNNMYLVCNNCKSKLENLNVKYESRKMPNILCIFINNKKEKEYKVSVKLEEKINLTNYLKSADIKEYNLNCAIIYSKQNDKYYALLKNHNKNNWLLYFENIIREENLQQVKEIGFPFLLIYKSKD